nr:uncharacterized protein LOC123755112 [Procambarus clarkii]
MGHTSKRRLGLEVKDIRLATGPNLLVMTHSYPSHEAVMVDDPKVPGGKKLKFFSPLAKLIDVIADATNFTLLDIKHIGHVDLQRSSSAGRCDYYLAREEFLPLMYSICFSRGHPLVPVFSKRIMRLTESGLYSQWNEELLQNYSFCTNLPTKVAIQTSLSIVNTMGMLLVLVCGLVLSLLVLGMELLYNHCAPM